jgi:hypothetical protein
MQVLDSVALSGSATTNRGKLPRPAHLGLALVFASVLALLLRFGPMWSFAGVAIATAALAWTRPAVGVNVLTVLAFSVDWLAAELALLPNEATFTIELLLAVLLVRAVWERWPERPAGTVTDVPAALLLVVGAGSGLLHGQSLWSIALGVRALFRFVILYYILLNLRLTSREWRGTIRLCVGLIFLQIVIGVYQFGVLDYYGDAVFGSVRSSGGLVLVSAFALCIVVCSYLRTRTASIYLVSIPLLFILPVLGEGKGFFFLIPIPLSLMFLAAIRRQLKPTLTVAAVVGVSQLIAIAVYGLVPGNANLLARLGQESGLLRFALAAPSVNAVTDARAKRTRFGRMQPRPWDPYTPEPPEVSLAASSWPRLQAIEHAYRSVTTRVDTALVGYGLGSHTFTRHEVIAAGSHILYVAPVARRLYETGFVGLALYWALLAATIVASRRAMPIADPYWRATAFALPGIVVLYIIAEAYTETLMDAPALTFWLIAAAAARHARRNPPASSQLQRCEAGSDTPRQWA